MQIIDVVTFNNEHDLFEIRYNILKDYVDEFIVVEFDKTFSGKPRESSFPFKDLPKVKHFFVTEDVWDKYMDMAYESPNTRGAEHWKTEFSMKESIKDCLTHLKDDDIVFIGDCDEIWRMPIIDDNQVLKLKLDVYTYYLNNRSNEEFWGTIVGRYGYIKDKCLNHLRTTDNYKPLYSTGWHFTSQGGIDALKKKMDDTYTDESYWNDTVKSRIDERFENNQDFLGRPFTLNIDEVDLPQYLKDNKEKYKHLWK